MELKSARSGGGGSFSIPELASDPVSPNAGDAWVLRSGGTVGGGDAYLPFPLVFTTSGTVGSATYELSYQTISDGVVRVSMS
jgi:hypothetical protein